MVSLNQTISGLGFMQKINGIRFFSIQQRLHWLLSDFKAKKLLTINIYAQIMWKLIGKPIISGKKKLFF